VPAPPACPLREEQCALRHEQRLRLPLRGRLEGAHEIIGTTHRQGQQLDPQHTGRGLVVVEVDLPIGVPGIHQECHAGEAGHGLGEQPKPFPA
jgi:hypothetical protein